MLVRPRSAEVLLRAARDPLPGQSRARAPLRPADRLRRRPAGGDARGRGAASATRSSASARSTGATPATARTSSSSSIAAGTGTRRRAAGWDGSGSAASSRSSTGCSGGPPTRAIRCCSADPASLPRTRFVITLDADTQMPRDTVGRLIGTLAHPLNEPRFDPDAGRVVEGYGVLQPRVSFHLTAATAFALRRAAGGVGGHRPLFDRGLRRLHGPLRPGELHRQGDLRRRCVRGGDRRDLPREPHPQPRPDRGELRAGAACSATPSSSTTSPPATTPTLAASTAGSAATGSCCPGWAARAGARGETLQSAARAGTMEALRQPPTQPGAAGPGRAAGPRLDGPAGLPLALDGDGPGRAGAPAPEVARGRLRRLSFARRRWRASGRGATSIPAMGGQALLAVVFLADQAWLMCDAIARTLMRLLFTRRQAAGVGNRRVDRATPRHRTCVISRPGCGRRRLLAVAIAHGGRSPPAGRALGCRPGAGRLAPLAGRGILGQPSQGGPPNPSCPRTSGGRFAGWREDLAFLRDLRRRRRTTGFPRTTSRRSPTAGSPIAPLPPTKACSCSRPWPHTTWATSAWAGWSSGWRRPSTRLERHGKALGTLLQLVRHAHAPAPAPGLHFDGRQRQLPRLPGGAQAGFEGEARPARAGPRGRRRAGRHLQASSTSTSRLGVPQLERLLEEPPGDVYSWDEWLERVESEAAALLGRLEASSSHRDREADEPHTWARALVAQVREHRAELAALAPGCRSRGIGDGGRPSRRASGAHDGEGTARAEALEP